MKKIEIRFCDAMTGTPADDTHAIRAVLAVPDLCSPFLETALFSYHGCFRTHRLTSICRYKKLSLNFLYL